MMNKMMSMTYRRRVLLFCGVALALFGAICKSRSTTTTTSLRSKLMDNKDTVHPSITTSHQNTKSFTTTTLFDCPCNDINLCQPIHGPPIRVGREIYGFIGNDESALTGLNWTYITTLAWASNDAIACEAHRHNARAVLAAPSFNLTLMAQDQQAQIAWVAQALQTVLQKWRDGIVFDHEAPLIKNSPEAQAYVSLVNMTKTIFHQANPSLQITVCAAWSPDGIDGRDYPYRDLADASDALYVMDYDTRSQIFDDCIASANAPIAGMKQGIERYMSLGIAPSKLILGVPFYGYRYKCLAGTKETDRYCPIEPYSWRGSVCSDAVGSEIGYMKLQKVRREFSPTTAIIVHRDNPMDAAYFNTVENGTVIQYWYDDEISLGHKYAWAKSVKLAGVGPYQFNNLNPALDPNAPSEEGRVAMWASFDSFFK
jgi:di-N-acetylchitobiase